MCMSFKILDLNVYKQFVLRFFPEVPKDLKLFFSIRRCWQVSQVMAGVKQKIRKGKFRAGGKTVCEQHWKWNTLSHPCLLPDQKQNDLKLLSCYLRTSNEA